MLETFILFEDQIGQALHAVLLAAAERGVDVHVLVDGFGSPDLSDDYIARLVQGTLCITPCGLRQHGLGRYAALLFLPIAGPYSPPWLPKDALRPLLISTVHRRDG